MSLKAKIQSILILVSVTSAVIVGALLVFLMELFGGISLEQEQGTLVAILAVGLYIIAALVTVGLLDILLNKKVIVPAIEKNMLENERVMLTEQLHHSQKMEAVGRLASSIAHDFNNLLTIIDGYASLIIASPQAEDVGQHAEEVVDAARRASFITRKLLSFSQKEAADPVLLDLNTTLQDTDKMLSRLIGEKVTLVTKPYPEPIHVLADPVQLGQILMNLAVNARDAMPNGGRITIKIGCRGIDDGECNKPSTISPGKYAEITVHDTGQGMDEETQLHIFEAFFTTKASDKGSGLGLSIVKSIMKQNNGFIDLQSKVGGGSTFSIYLPIVEEIEQIPEDPPERAEADVHQADSGESTDSSSATILLVEDDPMIRALVSQTLEMQGYTVLQAEEGWEGVKVARLHKGTIDLIFTDVVMPGLGGAELAMATQELYSDVKVLFMSGYSRSQLEEEGVPPDAAVLEKPFTPDKVITMVHQLIG
jgi:signal transduction histidine kinase